MMLNVILIAAFLILSIASIYLFYFGIHLDFTISKDTGVWGAFGDYMGGVLNPTLTFLTIVILIRSLQAQIDANNQLKSERQANQLLEKRKAFESLFFKMLDSLECSFSQFKLEFVVESKIKEFYSDAAIIQFESYIENWKNSNESDSPEKMFADLDTHDQIYNLIRRYQQILKVINDNLSDECGFEQADRCKFIQIMISFTNFSLLRLFFYYIANVDNFRTKYFINCPEFNKVIQENRVALDDFKILKTDESA
ncbi:hypothetical protein [Pseudoalteromonas xiamenensis]|uniref:Phage abortive infection protein n=1 Tax=Pseudoalteromonas xiamenensis TaxID=882626 RepID=A0A975HLP1_9GAMM|nr:hypothetical protein [Pseudoalteromonas xiamenensis]QTH72296.1 hypothetical protein J5O05_05355 [Pseudoalteromonas xiamenensis]